MSKQLFLETLRRKLRKLPSEEIDAAIDYYNEYFEEAGPENEQDVLENLGSPKSVASKILADYAVKDMDANPSSAKKGLSAIWFIILAIFASPIAIPIAMAITVLLLAGVVAGAALVFSFFSLVISLIVSGIGGLTVGFSVIFSHLPTALLFIGGGMVIAGIGLALLPPLFIMTRTIFRSIARWMKNQYEKMANKQKGGI